MDDILLSDQIPAPKSEPVRLRAVATDEVQPEIRAALVRHAFPAPMTALVGRADEVAAIRGLLIRDGVRLLTLIGPGGIGKTRLALRVAVEAAPVFPDGVVFVPLAAVTDPALVLGSVARALGLREDEAWAIAGLVAGHLRHQRVLLVLDNFEQVVPAAAALTALLAECPGVSLLVTSRIRLDVAAEQQYPVAPLALPVDHDDDDAAAVRAAAAAPAVQLFVARTQAIDPRFALNADNAAAVAAICRRLDGLPLAIELAAARTRLLSPRDMLSHLDPALPLLTCGPQDAPERLRTMRRAIAWSYDLLTEDERRLFRRLAVFVGGFTLETADSVSAAGIGTAGTAGTEGIEQDAHQLPATGYRPPSPDVLDLIGSLLDKSLLQRTEVQGESRLAMLETIREFAVEALETSGEADAVRRAHAACVARLAQDARGRLLGPEGPAVLNRLESEHDNLRAALAWIIGAGETELALRLTHAVWRFWWRRSQLAEGRAWLERALGLPDTGPASVALRPRIQVAAGYFARVQGDYLRASGLGVDALALAKRLDDPGGVSAALFLLALVATDRGELLEAESHLEASIAIDRSVQDAHGVAFGLSNLGDIALAQGRIDHAAGLADEALAIWRARGDAWGASWALIGRARIARAQGNRISAASLIGEALAECINLGDREIAARGISELAALTGERHQFRLAARLYGSVAALREAIGAPTAPSERAAYDAAVDAARARLPGTVFDASWKAGRALSPAQAVAEAAALVSQTSAPSAARVPESESLTPREREVLRLLADGQSNQKIADALFVSPRTAAAHVAAILGKLGVDSRTAAAAAAIREGLV